MHLGKEGYKKTVTGLIKRKLSFENEVRKKFPEVEITDGGGISIGLVNKRPFPENFLSKYGLFAKKQPLKFREGVEKFYIYKVSFLYR